MWIVPLDYLVVLVLSTLVNTGAGAWVLLRPSSAGKAVGPRRFLAAASLVAALTLIEIGVTFSRGANFFSIIMLAWIDLAFVVPAVGVFALVAARRGRQLTNGVQWIARGSLVLPLFAAYASLIEPFRLQLETATVRVSEARAGTGAVRIGVLSDLQTSRVRGHEREAVARLMAQKPHLILIPGDIYQGVQREFERAKPELAELIASLEAPGGVWVVSGNADFRAALPVLCNGAQAELLVNRIVEIDVGDRRIALLGLEDAGFTKLVVRRFEERAREHPDTIHVVLIHRPGTAVDVLAPESPIDLVVGGHTHGGQVALPFFGPPFTLSTLPRRVAAGGLHEVDGHTVYVSRGVGLERKWAPRVRFLCPPEISVLTLQ